MTEAIPRRIESAVAEVRPAAASQTMTDLAAGISDERLSVGTILDGLHARAPGLGLLNLAPPMFVPNVPGISPIVGLPLIAPAILLRAGVLTLLSLPVAIAAVAWVYFGAKYAIKFLAWFAGWGSALVNGLL